MNIPSFLKLKDNSLIFNEEGEFLFYLPESYFSDAKNTSVAMIYGSYVSTIGIMDWAIMSKNGTVGNPHPFRWSTIFLCKPYSIEKVKNLKLGNTAPKDYRVLHFRKGDEVVSDINTPQIIDNVENMFRMMVISGNKMPQTIPYDKSHEYYPQAMELNGGSFNLNMQIFGIMQSELCRDPNDISRPFRYTDMKDMNAYKQVSVKEVPKYTSPYVSITSENFDESLMAAVLIDDESKMKDSPLEKIVMQ